MNRVGLRRTLLQIVSGYSRSLRSLLISVALIAATVAVSAAVVFPLWYFSTHSRRAYTIAALALFGAGILFLLVRRSRAFWELPGTERSRRVRRFFARLLSVLAYLAGLYIILGFYAVGLLAAAIPLTVVYLLVLGYTLYVRRSRTRR